MRRDGTEENQGPRLNIDEPPLETGASPFRAETAKVPPDTVTSAYAPTHPTLSTCSLLIFATIWGVLARLGLEWIGGFAAGRAVFALVWAQVVGSFVMGIVNERKASVERLFPPLFPALGTGFCGSLTTWSSMANDVFTAFANLDEPARTSRFAGFLAGVAITFVTLTTSSSALQGGLQVGAAMPATGSPPRLLPGQSMIALLSLVAGPLFWLGSLFLLIFGPTSWRERATFAIVVAPPATLLRYFLSKRLNPFSKRFPIGTFTANSLAVLVFAVMALLARNPRSPLGCAALRGVQDGFCGSLSTISTLVVEVRGLGTGDSYRYLLASWIISMALFTVVLGPWVWSDDRGPLCWER
ncbi:FluC/FEX family fluoride channel [Rhodotorula paludigena]|uniref:FluC/FEX family fluoride channel n=1 Tax=Rhodotorula paludigena TaxID=86838 RepID=UPI00317963ED